MSKEVVYSTKFQKHYEKRIINNKNLAIKVEQRIGLFLDNPNEFVLNNHKLKGSKNIFCSFSVTGDYRIIYQEFSDHYSFLDIGTHNQVY